jgi:hypothetical protein
MRESRTIFGHIGTGRLGQLTGLGLALTLLAACESNPVTVAGGAAGWFPTPLLAAEIASMSLTNKTLVDNAYSMVSGKDCSTIRYLEGDYYCRQRLPDNTVVDVRLYCYRTLGKINCFDQPQPYQRNQQVAPSTIKVGSRTQRLEN